MRNSKTAVGQVKSAWYEGKNINEVLFCKEFQESSGYIRFKADAECSSRQLYEVYRKWCEDNATFALSSRGLINELRKNEKKYFLEYTNNVYLSGGKRVRGFMGIELCGEM